MADARRALLYEYMAKYEYVTKRELEGWIADMSNSEVIAELTTFAE